MVSLIPINQPRISANQLGEFIFATESKQRSILRDQKFGNESAAPYYAPALAAVRRSFSHGRLDGPQLAVAARELENREPKTPRQAIKFANNSLALESLASISLQIDPPPGQHRIVTRNAQMLLDGVTISVLPDIVTENIARGYIAFTKLRFSKSKISADVSEIVLLLLHHYGQRQSRVGLTFDIGASKVVDCFSKTVVSGHSLGRHRDQQLHRALALIRVLWPQIEAKA